MLKKVPWQLKDRQESLEEKQINLMQIGLRDMPGDIKKNLY